MKKLLIGTMLLALTGCTTHTPHGDCIGINGTENPKKIYEYSTTNVIVGILLSETVIVPVVVVLDDLKCPVGNK